VGGTGPDRAGNRDGYGSELAGRCTHGGSSDGLLVRHEVWDEFHATDDVEVENRITFSVTTTITRPGKDEGAEESLAAVGDGDETGNESRRGCRPMVMVFSDESLFIWAPIGDGRDTGAASALRRLCGWVEVSRRGDGERSPPPKSPLIRCSEG
jgi:hypothetical protein